MISSTLIGAPLENDVDILGPRVLGDVGQRLLCDPIQRRFGVGREPIVQQPGRVQRGRDADAIRPVLHVVRQRRAQAEIVERGRTKLPDQVIDVAVEPLRDGFDAIRRARASRRGRRTRP